MDQVISFLDIAAPYIELKADIDAAISRVLNSGWYVLGPEVEAFESERGLRKSIPETGERERSTRL